MKKENLELDIKIQQQARVRLATNKRKRLMSRRGQIVIGVEIVEKRQLKSELNAEKTALNAEKTALVGLRCWDAHGAYS